MNNLDRSVNNDFLIVGKSLLPYLNVDRQKPVAIFIKVMELLYTVNLFSNEASVRSMTRSQETGWEKDFLNDVKSNLSEDKAYFIDAILKLTEAHNLLRKQSTPSENDPFYSSNDYNLHPLDSGIPENQPFTDETPLGTANKPQRAPNTKQNGPNPEQVIGALSSMLDPSQAQLLKMLTTLLMPQSPPKS